MNSFLPWVCTDINNLVKREKKSRSYSKKMTPEEFFSLVNSYRKTNGEKPDWLYKACVVADEFVLPPTEELSEHESRIFQKIHEYCHTELETLQNLLMDRHGHSVESKTEAICVLILSEFPPIPDFVFSIVPYPRTQLVADMYNSERQKKIHTELLPMILKYERSSLAALREEYFQATGDITFLLNKTHLIAFLCVLNFNADLSVAEVEEKARLQERMKQEEPLLRLREELKKAAARKPIREIECEPETIADLIQLGLQYDPAYDYHFDMARLHRLVPVLKKLDDFIGLSDVKKQVVDQLVYFLQFEKKHDFMHTVLTGPPGVGKTEFAKLLGELYLAMGILKNNIFKKVVRSDLIAGFSGQTAIKTRDAVHDCLGGVMFIDEVYALGNEYQGNGHGNFSKECIDTLNELLSDERENFICIVAGYKDEIEKCFFSYNQGLRSRFPIRFTLEPYTLSELFDIFRFKVNMIDWKLDDDVVANCFEKDLLVNGRDVENFLSLVKRCHSKRVFSKGPAHKRKLNRTDIERAFATMKSAVPKPREETSFFMYL